MTAIALTIAGSDSGGGAGIQADLKAFSALGVYGASAITAITAQNTKAVTAIHPVPTDVIAAQIAAVLDDLDVKAIKIGMLGTPEITRTVAQALRGYSGPIVLDPVMVAKSGDRLLDASAEAALVEHLLPLATVVTPNLPEAVALIETGSSDVPDSLEARGDAIRAMGAAAVLMKGGHADGTVCEDVLVSDAPPLRLSAPRRQTRNTHGTGCTLSSSIAAGLAKGLTLSEAVREAHSYLQGAIAAADTLTIGSGHGPVHHFHALWSEPAHA